MNIIRRIVLALSIYRECNRPANYEYWTRKPIGRVGLRTAWRVAGAVEIAGPEVREYQPDLLSLSGTNSTPRTPVNNQ